MRMTDLAVKTQPQGHPHLHPTRAGEVAQIDDIGTLPAEPIAEPPGYFALRGGVVAAEEQVVVPGHQSGLHHQAAVDGVKGFYHERFGKLTLHLFPQRIGVADRQRGHPFREIEGIADMDENFLAQIGVTGLAERRERVGAVGAIEKALTKRGALCKRADLRAPAHGPKPRLTGIAVGSARTHHYLMAELNEFGGNGASHHAGTENCNFHIFVLRCVRPPRSQLPEMRCARGFNVPLIISE